MENSYNLHSNNYDNPPISLKDIIRKIIGARWWIFGAIFVVFIGTVYIVFSTPPTYQATASIIIEQNSKAQAVFNFGSNNNFKISDEIAVIRSRTIAEDVVKSLWESNKRNRLYVFGTKVFVPRGQRLRRPMKKLFSLGSWNVTEDAPPQYYEPYSADIGTRFYKNIIRTINAYPTRGTNIIQITVTSPHPHEAALIANLVAKAYEKKDREWNANESINLRTFLEERLNGKEKELDSIAFNIEEYKRTNKIYALDGNVDNLLSSLTSTETLYNNNMLELEIAKNKKNNLLNQLSSLEKDLATQILNTLNVQLFALRNQVNEKETELVRNSTVYGSKHEAVLKTKENLSNLKSQLENKTNDLIAEGLSIIDPLEYRQELISSILVKESEIFNLEFKSNKFMHLLNKYDSLMQKIPKKQMYLSKLEREKNVLESSHAYMRQKMEEARVGMASEPGKVRIINQATMPGNPIGPDIPRNLIMAVLIGAILGFSISIILEYFDNTVKSVEFIEQKKLPVLAIIPSIGNESNKYTGNKYFINKIASRKHNGWISVGKIQRRLITHEDPKSPISEAYRSLRTSLMYTKMENQGIIMVSSPGPGEGKTTTIINLAITYANLGKKTLLVDGDLRKPVLHKVFNEKNEMGLTHYLSGVEEKWKKIIIPTDVKNLHLILSGALPPNPSELIGSELMKSLLVELKKEYDVILFDAPPVMAVTDAVVLSKLIDQFILVVRFGSTDKDSINHTLAALNNVNQDLTGVVLNDLNRKNSYYSKNYYKYNEYYYASEENT